MKLVKAHLAVNKYSRPGKKLQAQKGVIMHWTAKPMADAGEVYDWFEGRKNGGPQYKGLEYGSTHYCVGLDGSIWEMIPPDEMAYHSGADKYTPEALKYLSKYPNDCTVAFETCVTNWAGDYTPETLASARLLTAVLMQKMRGETWFGYHNSIAEGWDCPRLPIIQKYRLGDLYAYNPGIQEWTAAKIGNTACQVQDFNFDAGTVKVYLPDERVNDEIEFSKLTLGPV